MMDIWQCAKVSRILTSYPEWESLATLIPLANVANTTVENDTNLQFTALSAM
jgi:hypothetical protein